MGEAASPGIAASSGGDVTKLGAMSARDADWRPATVARQPCGRQTPPLWCLAPAAPAAGGGLRRFRADRPWTQRSAGPAVRYAAVSGMGGGSRLRVSPVRHPPRSPDRSLGFAPGHGVGGLPGTPPSSPCGTCRVRTLGALSIPSGRPWCKRDRRRPSRALRGWPWGREPWGATPGRRLAPYPARRQSGPGPRRRRMDGRMTRVPCPRDWPPQAAISGRMQVINTEARWTGGSGRLRAAPCFATPGRVAPPSDFGSRHPDPPRRTLVPRGAEPLLR
ncbi:hypothetical protein SAMN02927895_02431 [Belnapia rosea]|uniref:Uncharacterized protein n=1 Tax=Belnapia rosea TaxID=938405 RepID=A0A1G6SRE8_9PROT|nr:hypothetical protein SAMN02927895_02431 [Belnapia rosea]SDD19500.1 hypothetical protein SAMN04487779_1005131 [Belnapia rosea]